MRPLVHAWPWLAVVPLLCGLALSREPGPHVHGIATLQIAVDGNTLTLSFESPLDNLLGFEHAPRTDAEQAAVSALRKRLQHPEAFFVPTSAAQCNTTSVKLDSPVFAPAPAAAADAHADLDAEFVLRCGQPAELHDLEVKLFSAYPRTQRIDAQVVGPRGQAAGRLTPQNPLLSW
jgi:Protein of unknown function (DUF2796)